ncbi:MAG: Holliday junction branch migration DNA helicase RuvB [Patescibacteria group bacterium]
MTQFKNHKIISPEELVEDQKMDLTLRPRSLAEFIGQEKMKESLRIFIQAAQQRKQPIEHVLLNGGPGLGKTTLAHIIAHEMKVNIRVTSGPALERAGDLAAILTNLSKGDILFIDEIHRLNRMIEEVLYPAMEEFGIDLVLGKGPSAKTIRLDLPQFTLIGATTRPSLLSSPLRDRFGVIYQLNFYTIEDIEEIIHRSAKILNVKISAEAIKKIAQRARFTPRVANRLLKRVRDFAQVHKQNLIDQSVAEEALNLLEIDEKGLNPMDRKILQTLIEKFNGGPVGLKSLAIAVGEEVETLEEIYEPYLIQIGFLNRTPRGRIATDSAYQHLKIKKGLL